MVTGFSALFVLSMNEFINPHVFRIFGPAKLLEFQLKLSLHGFFFLISFSSC